MSAPSGAEQVEVLGVRGKSKCCVNMESALMAVTVRAWTSLLADCAAFHRIMENGQERVEVEEDGQLKSVSINGEWGSGWKP